MNQNGSKRVLVNRIMENSKKLCHLLDNIRDNNNLKNVVDNLKSFTVEDFGKFFQNLANIQFLTSADEFSTKNKEIISINTQILNLQSDKLEFNDNIMFSSNIADLVTKKETSLKNFIKGNEEDLSSLTRQGTLPIVEHSKLTPKEFLDEIFNSFKQHLTSTEQIEELRRVIKLYTNFSSDKAKLEQQDKLLLDFIINNSDSTGNFYSAAKFWLFKEYIKGEETNNLYRYDSLLIEMIQKIESNKEILFDLPTWCHWIFDLPRVSKRMIDHILMQMDEYYTTNLDLIKKKCREKENKKDLKEIIPHLQILKQIYLKFLMPNVSEESQLIKDKILTKIFDFTQGQDKHLITRAIEFLLKEIYPLSPYEEKKITRYAIDKFRELTGIKDIAGGEKENEVSINQKYPLYFYLSSIDQNIIYELPSVYSESSQIVKSTLDKYMMLIIKDINRFTAEKLISECNEKCVNIVIKIIKQMFNPSHQLYTNKMRIIDEKIFRLVRKYYFTHSEIQLNTSFLSSVLKIIPLNDFFTENNFPWEQIKRWEDSNKNSEVIITLLNELNKNENVFIFDDLTDNLPGIQDKLVFYIIYYIFNTNASVNLLNDFHLKTFSKYSNAIPCESIEANFTFLLDFVLLQFATVPMVIKLRTLEYMKEYFKLKFNEETNVNLEKIFFGNHFLNFDRKTPYPLKHGSSKG